MRILAPAALILAACVSSSPLLDRTERTARDATLLREWSRAAELWESLWIHPDADDPRYGREAARARLELGEARRALEVLDATIEMFPTEDVELHALAARAFSATGSPERAAEALENVLEIDPNRADAWRELGELRLEIGLGAAAFEPLSRAAELAGDAALADGALQLDLGRAAEAAGDAASAVVAYARAFALDAGRPPDFVCAARLFDDPELREARPKELAASRRWLQRACELDPQNRSAHLLLAQRYREEGLDSLAIPPLHRAVELEPTDLGALVELAELNAQAGEPDRARALARHALGLAPEGALRSRLDVLLEELEADPEEE